MLKYVLLATAMTMSAPVLAQDMGVPAGTPQTTTPSDSTTSMPAPDRKAKKEKKAKRGDTTTAPADTMTPADPSTTSAPTAPATPSDPSMTTPTAPATPSPTPMTAQADPATAAPTQVAQATTTAPAPTAAVPGQTTTPVNPSDPAATPAPAQSAQQPAAGGSQVAQVVSSEFGSYDKNADGQLTKAEFASWMDKLKAADPAAKQDAATSTKWNDAAFAQADTDKSKSISQAELTSFLSGSAKS